MSNEFEIVAMIDQSVPIKMEQTLFDRIDTVLAQSLQEKDPVIALSVGKGLLGVVRLGGLGLAKLLHGVNSRWKDYEYSGTIYALAEDELGILAKATINRYIAVWEMITGAYIPNDVLDEVKVKPMRQLVPMASLITQGFDVSTKDWVRLAHATDAGEVAEIVREIKGKPPKKQSMKIVLEADGQLNAWNGGKIVNIGMLRVENETDEIVAKAIERIVNNSGIIRR
jgi:hypothetical protein